MTGPLKNARHERFAQELAKGSTADAAYVSAGFKPHGSNPARLSGNERIKSRVAELLGQAAELAKIDAAWVLSKAAILHEKAMEAKAYSAAKGALDLIGKHVEVQAFREQIQHSGLIEYKNLSDEEINARIAAHEATRASSPTTH